MTAAPMAGSGRGRPRSRIRLAIVIVIMILAAGALASLATGAVAIPPGEIIAAMVSPDRALAPDQAAVLWHIRLPRIVLAMLVGGTLAVAGAGLQGVFRNPLADPGLIGVSAGASLGAAGFLVLGDWLFAAAAPRVVPWLLPGAAFLGGLVAVGVLLGLARRRAGGMDVVTMLLAGIAINALAAAGTGLLIVMATDTQLRNLSFWTLGSLGGATWPVVLAALGPVLLTLAVMPLQSRALDLLQLGETEARHLGLDVDRLKRRVVVTSALGVGVAVAFTGMIGFVGLVVPHAVRLVLGPSHRGVVPIATLVGAAALLVADTAARTVAAPLELPIGVVTALVGAPAFLLLVGRDAAFKGLA